MEVSAQIAQWKYRPAPSAEDKRLLARVRQGDRAAFDTLFDRYGERVLRFAVQLTGCRADAEDLTQETFLAAFHGAERFAGHSGLLTYLFAIALRRNRDNGRKRRLATVPLWDEQDTDVHAPLTPDIANGVVSQIVYRQALHALDAPLREAFLLVAGEGLTQKEAAHLIGAPLGTVKWRVAEATRRLRDALTENSDD